MKEHFKLVLKQKPFCDFTSVTPKKNRRMKVQPTWELIWLGLMISERLIHTLNTVQDVVCMSVL